jgi:ribosomal protein S18
MDEALERGQLDLVVQHAQMLKEYTAKQPLPWSDFYAERALALARVSADANCEQSQRELSVLVERAREFGVMRALPQC